MQCLDTELMMNQMGSNYRENKYSDYQDVIIIIIIIIKEDY